MADEPTYSKDQVQAILGRALELRGMTEGLSHKELIDAAGEVGIPSHAVEQAISELHDQHNTQIELRALRRRQWRGLVGHLVPFVMVNALLALGNALTGDPPWMLFILIGWGIGMVLHFIRVAFPDEQRLMKTLERQRERDQRRARRRRIKASAKELKSAMENGVANALEQATEKARYRVGAEGERDQEQWQSDDQTRERQRR